MRGIGNAGGRSRNGPARSHNRTGWCTCSEIKFLDGGCSVKNKATAQLARTAAAQRMREHRARKAIGATRIAIDLDGDDKDWLRSQGVLREWDEDDERALAQALKLVLHKLRHMVTT